MRITTTEHTVKHPMENIFDIESGSTVVEIDQAESELIEEKLYDDKDVEIEQQFEHIYNMALLAYTAQTNTITSGIDPRGRARNMEVANGFLGTALSAIKEKANLKQQKEKIKATKRSSDTNITNNNLIMDRDELLRIMMNRS